MTEHRTPSPDHRPGMHVRDWMTRQPVVVTPSTSVLNARRLLSTYGIRHLPVVEGSMLVGMLSDRDLRPADPAVAWALATLRSDLVAGRYRTVSTLVSTRTVAAGPDEPVAAAARRMIEHRIGALPVVRGRQLVGILSIVDCLQAFLETDPAAAETDPAAAETDPAAAETAAEPALAPPGAGKVAP